MNIIMDEEKTEFIAPEVKKMFMKHKKVFIELVVESLKNNFRDYIHLNIKDTYYFYLAAERAIHKLFHNMTNHYINKNMVRKDVLVRMTKHTFSSKKAKYDEIMIDFPLGFALFELNETYHAGFFKEKNPSKDQQDSFSKGLCISSHMFSFVMYVLFRFEVFQDLTFARIVKDFKNNNIYINYPQMLKKHVYKRTNKFDWSLVLGD